MSTGLFIFAERRTPVGAWERAEPIIPNPEWENENWLSFVAKHPQAADEEPREIREPLLSWWWGHRHLPSVLTYGDGFRDVNKDEIVTLLEPIAKPRGLPPDLSKETMEEYEEHHPSEGPQEDPDPSWLLLREVLDYDWEQEYVRANAYAIAPGAPRQFRPLPEGEGWEPYGEPWRGERWQGRVQMFLQRTGQTWAETVGEFYSASIPKLLSYGEPDEVRIVFWYEY